VTSIEVPGEGNINYVRRVRTRDGSSLVLKQAHDALERFPEYRVGSERLLFEERYARTIDRLAPEQASILPRILFFSADQRVIVMEDLGEAPLLEEVLLQGSLPAAALRRIGTFLAGVDAATRKHVGELAPSFRNHEMQRSRRAQQAGRRRSASERRASPESSSCAVLWERPASGSYPRRRPRGCSSGPPACSGAVDPLGLIFRNLPE
jgi:hypothetical protein